MNHVFTYSCGALVADSELGGEPYRIERRLRDEDTWVGLYVIKRIDSDTELLRNGKLIDNPTCFSRYVVPVSGNAVRARPPGLQPSRLTRIFFVVVAFGAVVVRLLKNEVWLNPERTHPEIAKEVV